MKHFVRLIAFLIMLGSLVSHDVWTLVTGFVIWELASTSGSVRL